MSNGKTELFVFLGAAFAALIGLVVLNRLYASYIDVRYHARLAEAGPAEGMLAARQDDQAKLQQGKIPLDQAIARIAQRGRDSFNSIAPAPSQYLSAISGWIHRPGFKPVVAHPIRIARAPAAPTPQPEAAQAPAGGTAAPTGN